MEIQTTKHQEERPPTRLTDSNNVPFNVGDTVAYNYMGMVIKGKIVSYESGWRETRPGVDNKMWWSIKFKMEVRNEEGHISTLSNPNSFIII